MFIVRNELFEAYRELLFRLIEFGKRTSPRDLETQEILGVSLRVTNALSNVLYHPVRDLNYKFMIAEWLWIMAGSDDLEEIAQYNSQLRSFSDDGVRLNGAYGPRLISQFSWIVEKLIKEDATRQAVAIIWQPGEKKSKDVPCTVSLQFLWREGRINLIVSMRSSDAWLGLPYDFFVFSMLLNCVCGMIYHSKPGFVQFNLGSSHLYSANLEKAMGLLDKTDMGYTIVSPRVPGMPPEDLLDVLNVPTFANAQLVTKQPWQTYANVLASPKGDAVALLTSQFG